MSSPGAVSEDLMAVSERSAARMAGVTLRQLRYWADTHVVVPSVSDSFGRLGRASVYTFRDVLELLVAARLREFLSLQQIRSVLSYLRSKGYDHPLVELRFAVDAGELYFQHPDGSWEGGRQPGQTVLEHVLRLEPLRQQIRDAIGQGRDRALRGQAVRQRRLMGSKPVFAGTRTPLSALFPYLERRYTTARILESFPHLSREDVTLARQEWRSLTAA